MRDTLRLQIPFLTAYLIFLILGFVYLVTFQKGDMNLFFMCNRSMFLDSFFKLSTSLAEGMVIMMIGVVLLLQNYKNFIAYLIMLLIMSGLVNFFKKVVFQTLRPAAYFQDYIPIEPIPGVVLMKQYSFPSGHTTAAFSIFFLLSLFYPNKRIQILCFVAALSCGISRIYLQQHFFIDVYAGSVLGVTISFCLYLLWQHFSIDSLLSSLNKKENA